MLSFTHVQAFICSTNSGSLTLSEKSVSKADWFDSRHMSSRRRVCRLINHLAADDLWSEWPYHDKVSETCTSNYRSEGSTYINMQHQSLLLLIALQWACALYVCSKGPCCLWRHFCVWIYVWWGLCAVRGWRALHCFGGNHNSTSKA